MSEPVIRYDEPSDTVYVSFIPGASGMAIELNENVLLRIDQHEWLPVGLVLFNYSVLAQKTELGLRSYPLTGLEQLAPEFREKILALLRAQPLSRFLRLSAYVLPDRQPTPITSVEPEAITPRAA